MGLGWIGWLWISPGGVRYRSSYTAKKNMFYLCDLSPSGSSPCQSGPSAYSWVQHPCSRVLPVRWSRLELPWEAPMSPPCSAGPACSATASTAVDDNLDSSLPHRDEPPVRVRVLTRFACSPSARSEPRIEPLPIALSSLAFVRQTSLLTQS